jgi:hypothetical protein
MTRLLLIGLAVLSVAAQSESRHDKYKDDAHAYCWSPRSSGSEVARRERDPHAHKCACHLMCLIGADGTVIGDQEDRTCELYCTRARCTCHVEEPCEKKG